MGFQQLYFYHPIAGFFMTFFTDFLSDTILAYDE